MFTPSRWCQRCRSLIVLVVIAMLYTDVAWAKFSFKSIGKWVWGMDMYGGVSFYQPTLQAGDGNADTTTWHQGEEAGFNLYFFKKNPKYFHLGITTFYEQFSPLSGAITSEEGVTFLSFSAKSKGTLGIGPSMLIIIPFKKKYEISIQASVGSLFGTADVDVTFEKNETVRSQDANLYGAKLVNSELEIGGVFQRLRLGTAIVVKKRFRFGLSILVQRIPSFAVGGSVPFFLDVPDSVDTTSFAYQETPETVAVYNDLLRFGALLAFTVAFK